ncbi:hypothetical protein FOA52_001556 [Chlamydomonas sp. UWO 241]|nr:hypothetical protein FOA52_001556 [Chlamydomonas sp. UWO 241]
MQMQTTIHGQQQIIMDQMENRKRPAADGADGEPGAKRTEGTIVFRVACPSEKTGPIIGKGGTVIRDIRETTGARITIGDAPPGLQERGIVILSHDRPGGMTCGAQDALDRVICRLFEPDAPLPGADNAAPSATAPEHAHVTLLIDRIFVGTIVGKGGENITRVRQACPGVTVTLKAKGQGNALEGPDEETFIIEGQYQGVRNAARQITDKVRECVAHGTFASQSTMTIAHTHSGGRPDPNAPAAFRPPSGPAAAPGAPGTIRTEYRLLVLDMRVGGIIGKGGDRLKQLREQSRADIKIDRINDTATERLITCWSHEPAHAEYCAAAEACMMVASRAVSDRTTPPDAPVQLRLLAKHDQMGAVLGVKGSIIQQVSMDTGARLQVLDPNNPAAASVCAPGDSVLEISGLQGQVMEAVRIATMLLRGAMIRAQQGPGGAAAYAPPPQQYAPPPAQYGAPADPYAAYNQQQAAYAAQSYAPPPAAAQSYDPYGAPPAQPAAAPADPYAAYYAALGQAPPAPAQPVYTPADPYASYQQPAAAATYNYQQPAPAAAPVQSGYNSQPHSYGAPSGGGGGGGSKPAVSLLMPSANPPINSLYNPTISSTGLAPGLIRYSFALESTHCGTLLGARGSNVAAIRTVSGARIKLSESAPGQAQREVEISGQPTQVSVAHTAVQGLLSTGELPHNCRT